MRIGFRRVGRSVSSSRHCEPHDCNGDKRLITCRGQGGRLGDTWTVASENVERVQAVLREWGRGNFRAGQEMLAPDVTFITYTSEGDHLTYHGPAEVAGWMRDFLRTWRDLRIEAQDVLEVDDKVLALCRQYAKGRHSSVEVEMPTFSVWTFRDGQVIRLQHLRDRAEAFSAAGLSE